MKITDLYYDFKCRYEEYFMDTDFLNENVDMLNLTLQHFAFSIAIKSDMYDALEALAIDAGEYCTETYKVNMENVGVDGDVVNEIDAYTFFYQYQDIFVKIYDALKIYIYKVFAPVGPEGIQWRDDYSVYIIYRNADVYVTIEDMNNTCYTDLFLSDSDYSKSGATYFNTKDIYSIFKYEIGLTAEDDAKLLFYILIEIYYFTLYNHTVCHNSDFTLTALQYTVDINKATSTDNAYDVLDKYLPKNFGFNSWMKNTFIMKGRNDV